MKYAVILASVLMFASTSSEAAWRCAAGSGDHGGWAVDKDKTKAAVQALRECGKLGEKCVIYQCTDKKSTSGNW